MNTRAAQGDLAAEVARYYAARAPQYDDTAGYSDARAERLRAPVKARLKKLLAGRDVLEIACGTGYWTDVVAETARSVTAVDLSSSMVERARERLRNQSRVVLLEGDAYTLDQVPQGFDAAFSVWWWSHMPKARWRDFVDVLHSHLTSGALVLMRDQTSAAYVPRDRKWVGDDLVELRATGDGRLFEVVKNFPTERELSDLLRDSVRDLRYREFADECTWELSYRVP